MNLSKHKIVFILRCIQSDDIESLTDLVGEVEHDGDFYVTADDYKHTGNADTDLKNILPAINKLKNKALDIVIDYYLNP